MSAQYPISPVSSISYTGTAVINPSIAIHRWSTAGQCQLPKAIIEGTLITLYNDTANLEVSITAQPGSGATYTGSGHLWPGTSQILRYLSGAWSEVNETLSKYICEKTELHTDMMDGSPVSYAENDYCIMRFTPNQSFRVKKIGVYVGVGVLSKRFSFALYNPDGLSRICLTTAQAAADSNGYVMNATTVSNNWLTAGINYHLLMRSENTTLTAVPSINWGITGASQSGSGMTSAPSSLAALSLTPTTYRHLVVLRSF